MIGLAYVLQDRGKHIAKGACLLFICSWSWSRYLLQVCLLMLQYGPGAFIAQPWTSNMIKAGDTLIKYSHISRFPVFTQSRHYEGQLDNATLWQQLNQRQLRHSNTQNRTYGLGTCGSLMARLPNFQMNHGDSGILNLTNYRCYQLN